jgi:hypothetical protein
MQAKRAIIAAELYRIESTQNAEDTVVEDLSDFQFPMIQQIADEEVDVEKDYHKTYYGSDQKPESNVKAPRSTVPHPATDYSEHIYRGERTKAIRTFVPLSFPSYSTSQGYNVMKPRDSRCHVAFENTTKHIGFPSEPLCPRLPESKTAIQGATEDSSPLREHPASNRFTESKKFSKHGLTPERQSIVEKYLGDILCFTKLAKASHTSTIHHAIPPPTTGQFKVHSSYVRQKSAYQAACEAKQTTKSSQAQTHSQTQAHKPSTLREISPPPTRRNPRPQKSKQIFLSEVDDEWQNMSNTVPLVAIDPAEQEWQDVDINSTTTEKVVEKELEGGEDWIWVGCVM